MVPEFTNEPLTDFSNPANRQAMENALRDVKGELDQGRRWPLVIAGQAVTTDGWIDSLDPCEKTTVVGRVAKAGRNEAERALEAAWEVYDEWAAWDPAHRARLVLKAAALMRRRKHLFSATMVYEAGKTWPEADADTAEAIDFIEFYGREALRLAQPQPLTRLPGEDNE
ncbi:MAG TPA: aldehyde dehydrogenase family protein, partial [Chloroflexota bacterium]|nr:aldehyde dehydrogenase family protein [Chloroflexota bacterium]